MAAADSPRMKFQAMPPRPNPSFGHHPPSLPSNFPLPLGGGRGIQFRLPGEGFFFHGFTSTRSRICIGWHHTPAGTGKRTSDVPDTIREQKEAEVTKVPPAPVGVAKKVRIAHLRQMKEAGRPITMVTAYDAPTAALADEAGIDVILVGDSVGTAVHGFETTLPVTLDMMVLHTSAVVRGARRALVVADLPFMTYQVDEEQALRSATRLMQESGAAAVKLESVSERTLPMIRALTEAGIPVMGHIGLVPQSVHQLSGYRIQGRNEEEAERLLCLARKIEEAGAFAIVLELMAEATAHRISESMRVPTIGIGAGAQCDGQVLVINDLLGLTAFPPSFARKYIDLRAGVLRALRKYARDVRERSFPSEDNIHR